MYYKESELIACFEKTGKRISDLTLEMEASSSKRSEKDIRNDLLTMLRVMESSSSNYLKKPASTTMNLIKGFSEKLFSQSKKNGSLAGKAINELMALAFSTIETNASMGKIVAAPTAGSSGIIPACLMYYKKNFTASDEDLIDALLTATGIGHIIGRFATFAGAEGGCQAECGSAAAMASGALVFLKGGSTSQILGAAGICLMNIMGLVCDPIGGIVEFPCGYRNASGAVNAVISADMALAGLYGKVPFEQVVKAMDKVGKSLPYALRETGLGGVAGTDEGLKIRKDFFHIEENS